MTAPRETGLVQKTIWILRAVAARSDGAGLSEIARAAGIPKATCYRILHTLEEEAWLVRDSHNRYRVSLGLLLLVGSLLDQGSEHGHALAILRDLSAEVEETSGLDQLVAPSVMVAAQVQGPHVISHTSKPVPRMLPPWTTSTGKVLLAWTDPDVVREQFAEDYSARGPGSDFEAFLGGLGEVRRQGYGFAFDEMEEGLAAVAAPVRVGASVPYSIWVSGPSYRITRERIPELAVPVRKAADKLSRILQIRALSTDMTA
jgi:IclR family transcriptional regulator, acetate operon repressor